MKLKKQDNCNKSAFYNFYISTNKKQQIQEIVEIMKQVKNGYAECYYMLEDGNIYNTDKEQILKPNSKHTFLLKTLDGKWQQIAQRTLYKLVYNEIFCKDSIDNIDNEQWKEIHDTDGYYYISNKGRIKSMQGYNAIVLKPYKNNSDYDRVDIVYKDYKRSILVHRLVAQYFLPLPDSIDMQLHHKDFNKHNNSADNLVWLKPTKHSQIHIERKQKEHECTKLEDDIDIESERKCICTKGLLESS